MKDSNGNHIPDFLTVDGLSTYQLLNEHTRYKEVLQHIATSHPINYGLVATTQSLMAHKALRPNCGCERCIQTTQISPETTKEDVTQDFDFCDCCSEKAFDGRICHCCGAKKI